MTAKLLRPLSRPRLIGEATLKPTGIVFTCTGIDSFEIDTPRRAWVDLANVRTQDQAVAFVSKYGPVDVLPEKFLQFGDRFRVQQTFKKPFELVESVEKVLEVAESLRTVVRLIFLCRRATGGDRNARNKLARFCRSNDIDVYHEQPEAAVSRFLAMEFETMLSKTHLDLRSASPGSFNIYLRTSSLITESWLAIASELTPTASVNQCANPSCERIFERTHGKQTYCDTKCNGRDRQRRLAERREKNAKTRKE